MKGMIERLDVGGRRCALYLPPEYGSGGRYPVVYLNGTDALPDIFDTLECHFEKEIEPFLCVNIEAADWNGDMTPWPAPALFKNDGPFNGRADAYLDGVVNQIKPFVDAHYRTRPEPGNTVLMGYSLGGLAALYALYQCPVFGKIGSMSGSLWYDGWLDFMETHQPENTGARVYLSLGTKEGETRNERVASVGSCTQKAAEILKGRLTDENNVFFEWNDGGHFTEIPHRYIRALLWLMAL